MAVESKRTIEIDEFVPNAEIGRTLLQLPDARREVGGQAFAVIRGAVRQAGKVAVGKVVFASRERVIALEPHRKGQLGMAFRYPYEVRDEKDYFDDIPDEKIHADMLELAHRIVESKSGQFMLDEASFFGFAQMRDRDDRYHRHSQTMARQHARRTRKQSPLLIY
jgi:DNA end-binding protein Ku